MPVGRPVCGNNPAYRGRRGRRRSQPSARPQVRDALGELQAADSAQRSTATGGEQCTRVAKGRSGKPSVAAPASISRSSTPLCDRDCSAVFRLRWPRLQGSGRGRHQFVVSHHALFLWVNNTCPVMAKVEIRTRRYSTFIDGSVRLLHIRSGARLETFGRGPAPRRIAAPLAARCAPFPRRPASCSAYSASTRRIASHVTIGGSTITLRSCIGNSAVKRQRGSSYAGSPREERTASLRGSSDWRGGRSSPPNSSGRGRAEGARSELACTHRRWRRGPQAPPTRTRSSAAPDPNRYRSECYAYSSVASILPGIARMCSRIVPSRGVGARNTKPGPLAP